MDSIPPPPDAWPTFLNFIRDWVFIPAVGVVGWLWNEIRLVKKAQREQLDRIERALTEFGAALSSHEIDDLKRYASKEDLGILRADVIDLKRHIDERFDRLTDLVTK